MTELEKCIGRITVYLRLRTKYFYRGQLIRTLPRKEILNGSDPAILEKENPDRVFSVPGFLNNIYIHIFSDFSVTF